MPSPHPTGSRCWQCLEPPWDGSCPIPTARPWTPSLHQLPWKPGRHLHPKDLLEPCMVSRHPCPSGTGSSMWLHSQDRWGSRRAPRAVHRLCATLGIWGCHTSVPQPLTAAVPLPCAHCQPPCCSGSCPALPCCSHLRLPAPPVWVSRAYVLTGVNTKMESQA